LQITPGLGGLVVDAQIEEDGIELPGGRSSLAIAPPLDQDREQIEADESGLIVLIPLQEPLPCHGQDPLGTGEIPESGQHLPFRYAQLEKRGRLGPEGLPQATREDQAAGFSELSTIDQGIEKALLTDGKELRIAFRIEQGEALSYKG
jgi:hypothetical protein